MMGRDYAVLKIPLKLWSWTLANSPEFVEVNIFTGAVGVFFGQKWLSPGS